jgi:hypothetical protein
MDLQAALLQEAESLEARAKALRKALGCLEPTALAAEPAPKAKRGPYKPRKGGGTRMICQYSGCGRGYISHKPVRNGLRAGKNCCSKRCHDKRRREGLKQQASLPLETPKKAPSRPVVLLPGDAVSR